MKTVKEILNIKGNEISSVTSEDTVFKALELMAAKNIGALLVIDNEKLSGIFSERDYARKVILQGKSSKEIKIKEIMSENVLVVSPERTPEECMALMINKNVRHLPVIDNEKLSGIISIGDVVKAVIDEKEFLIEQLVHYIKSVPSIK